MAMLSVFERVLLLQDLEFFSLVRTEHLADFAALCKAVEAEGGSVLFRRGDPCSSLYFLVRGTATLDRETDSPETVEADVLDAWSFFAQTSHAYTAQADGRCTLLLVSFVDLAELLIAEPEFCWAVTRSLARRALEE